MQFSRLRFVTPEAPKSFHWQPAPTSRRACEQRRRPATHSCSWRNSMAEQASLPDELPFEDAVEILSYARLLASKLCCPTLNVFL
jgi:hypothetical protein